MYNAYCIPITVAFSLFYGAAIARDFDPKLKDPAYWEGEISESIAIGIINQIPNVIEEQSIERKHFEQSTDDAYMAKLKKKFFSFVESKKINQARAISKLMVKNGDYTGERYLRSHN